ncbi:MAG: recombination-associated protein RdgC, partial [Neisseriaceae bacterium]|nr:recombination-associated protein RdgC [Neisseriaceae bacterium]
FDVRDFDEITLSMPATVHFTQSDQYSCSVTIDENLVPFIGIKVIGDDLSIKRIRFLDIVQEEAENNSDDIPALTAATQLLATQTLADMIDELIAHLGGLTKE